MEGNIKIADFGLSSFFRPGKDLKTTCGSLSYLAPELFKVAANAGPPLDVWSVGVILFALLSGKLPFEEHNLHSKARLSEGSIQRRITK